MESYTRWECYISQLMTVVMTNQLECSAVHLSVLPTCCHLVEGEYFDSYDLSLYHVVVCHPPTPLSS